MSVFEQIRTTDPVETDRRRSDLDGDLVAVLGMVAILLLTGACFLLQSVLPF